MFDKFKAPKFKVNNRVRITSSKTIFSKCYTKNWSRKIFIIESVLKTNFWTYKIKDLNGEKIAACFNEKYLLLNILSMSYYRIIIMLLIIMLLKKD